MDSTQKPILKLDVAHVLKDKLPTKYRYIPKILVKWIEKTIRQEQLNKLLFDNKDYVGVDFASAVLKDLNITIKVKGEENIPDDGKFIFASNHPLGALDGMALITFLGKRYNGNLKFMVNDILMAVKPLAPIFLPINKHGKQSREKAQIIENAFNSDCQIATFPAGLCSRNLKGNLIEDLTWQKGFISKSQDFQRDIIPIFFEGYNSRFFYKLGKIRRRLGLKFNIEMIYLPSEIFKSKNKTFTIHFGKPISWETFNGEKTPMQWASYVRDCTYKLKD